MEKKIYKPAYVSCSEDEYDVDEHRVTNITFKEFYTSHRLLALIFTIIWVIYNIYQLNENNTLSDNIYRGLKCASIVFLVLSCMLYPNGPFIRPHPVVWRALLGFNVIYLIAVIFILFLSYDQIRSIQFYFDPDAATKGLDLQNYAEDCRLKWEVIKTKLDIFCIYHFTGWVSKQLIIRHMGITWAISIMWELTELYFQHLLPNFKECWWDMLVLDVLLCNGLGILTGYYILKWFACRDFHWESVKMIKGTKGKLKRMVLQFSPLSLDNTNWFSSHSLSLRIAAISVYIIIFQIHELNVFFIKHIFWIDYRNFPLFLRSAFLGFLGQAASRQYYEYITNPKIKTVGIYSWVFITITFVEAAIVIRHGRHLFENIKYHYFIMWLLSTILATMIITCLGVYYRNKFSKKNNLKEKVK